MIIVDCIETVDNIINSSFKCQSLNEFSKLQGESMLLVNESNIQAYAFYSKGMFYLNTMEELNLEEVRFKVYKVDDFTKLTEKVNEIFNYKGLLSLEKFAVRFGFIN